jgi:hypothetical protein
MSHFRFRVESKVVAFALPRRFFIKKIRKTKKHFFEDALSRQTLLHRSVSANFLYEQTGIEAKEVENIFLGGYILFLRNLFRFIVPFICQEPKTNGAPSMDVIRKKMQSSPPHPHYKILVSTTVQTTLQYVKKTQTPKG